MPPTRVLDSHIHLWPSTSTQPTNHGWMTRDHPLAKRHGISDYCEIARPQPTGFIYIETDRYLPCAKPGIEAGTSSEEATKKLRTWAKEPLEELRFLRRIVDGTPVHGDGFADRQADLMKGVVIWAPFHLPTTLFQAYLHLAQETSGPRLWERVVGFRYLLQGKRDGEVKTLVESEDWARNLLSLRNGRGGKGWAFDVGVDTHRDGVEPLEAVVGMIACVRTREDQSTERGHVRFVLNHLCKPVVSAANPVPHPRWKTALSRLAHDPNVFMKLSDGFNEFDPSPTPSAVPSAIEALSPFFDFAFSCFAGRVLFGSDWPVCNVGGPKGEAGNWAFWVAIVEAYMAERRLEGAEREGVWWRAGSEAYLLEF